MLLIRALRHPDLLLFGLLLVAAPLCKGGMAAEFQWSLSLGAVFVAFISLFRDAKRGLQIRWPHFCFLFLAILTCIQLIPLPASLLQVLSPKVLEYYSAGHAFTPPASAPISLDPPGTALAACQQCAFFALMFAAAQKRGEDRLFLCAALFLSALVSSCVALCKLAIFQKWSGPFVNPNHMSSLCLLGALSGLGLALKSHDSKHRAPLPRLFCAIGAVICIAACLATESRGGNLALGIGLCGLICARLHHQSLKNTPFRNSGARSRIAIAITVILLLVIPIAAFFGISDFTQELKIQLWNPLGRYLQDFWRLGSGRNSFLYVYPHFQTAAFDSMSVSHPENILLQLACEWGFLGLTAALLGILGLFWMLYQRRPLTAPDQGLCLAVIAILLHELCDFGLETSGLSLPFAATLGILLRPHQTLPTGKLLSVTNAVIAVAALSWVSFPLGLKAIHFQEDLQTLKARKGASQRAFALTATLRHPADPFIALACASRLEATNGDLSERSAWIERAKFLYPTSGHAAWLEARLNLQKREPLKAAQNYGNAYLYLSLHRKKILLEAISGLSTLQPLTRLLAQAPEAFEQLCQLLLAKNRPDLVQPLARYMILEQAPSLTAFKLLTEACLQLRDWPCAGQYADLLYRLGARFDSALYQSKLRLLQKKSDDGWLRRATGEAQNKGDWFQIYRQAMQLGQFDLAEQACDALWKLTASTHEGAADVLHRRAQLAAAQRKTEKALSLWEAAIAHHPREDIVRAAAAYAEKQGQAERAKKMRDKAPDAPPQAP